MSKCNYFGDDLIIFSPAGIPLNIQITLVIICTTSCNVWNLYSRSKQHIPTLGTITVVETDYCHKLYNNVWTYSAWVKWRRIFFFTNLNKFQPTSV